MDSIRQNKVARLIQRDLSEMFQQECKEYTEGAMLSVTAVRVSPDLSYAKIYVSIFPSDAMIAPFPMAPFPLINAPTSTDDLSYYRIIPSATTKGVDIWLRFSWFIQRKGVFEITYQLKGADDTGIVQRVKK